MKKFYVVGSNASKSLSPTIFNHWFKIYKIKAEYTYIQTNKKKFNKKINETLSKKETQGLNITIPFKEDAYKIIKKLDKHSKKINAVNCIYKKNQKIFGTNTDWSGYADSLKNVKINKNKKIIILGYGGAAKAICHYFSLDKKNQIVVFNRTKKLVKSQNKYTEDLKKLNNHLPDASIIVNTIPKNIIKKKHKENIKKTTVVSDIIYKPKETAFLKQFKKNRKVYGISMLISQAAYCFKIWFGFSPKINKKLLQKLDKKIK